jgi:hypothetical protein
LFAQIDGVSSSLKTMREAQNDILGKLQVSMFGASSGQVATSTARVTLTPVHVLSGDELMGI